MIVFTSGLGIATGDVVRTSYTTRPYRVSKVVGPRLWYRTSFSIAIFQRPVVSLALAGLAEQSKGDHYINDIWRDGERWFSGRDEVYVEHAAAAVPAQMSLFAPAQDALQPYPYTEGVDYGAGDHRVWHCDRCLRDYNGAVVDRASPGCPTCDWGRIAIIVMPDQPRWSVYQHEMGVPARYDRVEQAQAVLA